MPMNREPATVGIVAGSGIELRDLLDEITSESLFSEFPQVAPIGVSGHSGRFVRGIAGKCPVIVQCGRLHFYEGFDYSTVARTVDVMAGFGAKTMVFTNAAGGLRPEMQPGDLLAVDAVRPFVRYKGWPDAPDKMSPDFVLPGCTHQGAYFWVHGPSYETRAEIAALRSLGAAAIGMSTAPELYRCRELGLRAAIISCITNNCCCPQHLTHEHVVETARRASARIVQLIRNALPSLASKNT